MNLKEIAVYEWQGSTTYDQRLLLFLIKFNDEQWNDSHSFKEKAVAALMKFASLDRLQMRCTKPNWIENAKEKCIFTS